MNIDPMGGVKMFILEPLLEVTALGAANGMKVKK